MDLQSLYDTQTRRMKDEIVEITTKRDEANDRITQVEKTVLQILTDFIVEQFYDPDSLIPLLPEVGRAQNFHRWLYLDSRSGSQDRKRLDVDHQTSEMVAMCARRKEIG